MTWIEKEALGQGLRDAIPLPDADDEFAMLLAKIDKLTEADATPVSK